jgi:hypothetical protein
MPRLPVDGKKVVEHRITLGTKERDLLDQATFAYSANRWLTPTLQALGDPVFLLVLVGAIGLAVDRLLPGIDWRTITQDMTPDQVHDWLETQNIIGGAIGGIIGGILGLGIGAPWFGAAAGTVAGNVVVEGGEWVIEETGEALGSAAAANPGLFTFILIQIANSYSALGLTNGATNGSSSGGGGTF